MNKNKFTYDDIKQYESLFFKAPPIILKSVIKKNTNLVEKFKKIVILTLKTLSPENKLKLERILTSSISELQDVMLDAYKKTGKKQFKILSEKSSEKFIEYNLNELKLLFF